MCRIETVILTCYKNLRLLLNSNPEETNTKKG
jgi:hypothetical protein